MDTLERAEHPYPRWVSTAALGVMAGGFSLLLGAGALVVVIATVTTALIDRVGRVLNGWQLPILFQQVVGAALATGITIGLDAAGRLPAATAPSLVVAANIVALLSGLATVGSVQDAITGYQLTAVSRMMEIGRQEQRWRSAPAWCLGRRSRPLTAANPPVPPVACVELRGAGWSVNSGYRSSLESEPPGAGPDPDRAHLPDEEVVQDVDTEQVIVNLVVLVGSGIICWDVGEEPLRAFRGANTCFGNPITGQVPRGQVRQLFRLSS